MCSSDLQFLAQFRARVGAAHGALHAQAEGDFFEFGAVFVLAIVDRVHQFVRQGIEHLDGIVQDRRDEDLVQAVAAALARPALAHMVAAGTRAGKAA